MIKRLKAWLTGKPKTWEDLTDQERSQIIHQSQVEDKGKQLSVVGDDVFGDAFGASAVSPDSSKIGATTLQHGIESVMTRRLFEPRQLDEE